MVATSGCRATHTNKVCLLSILQQVWTRLNQSESRTGTIPFGICILEYCELILIWVRVLRPLCHAEDVSANLRRFKQNNNRKVKVMWHTAKYDDQYSEFVLCNYPSKCTHIAVNTHTVNSHPEQWAAIYAAAHGEQLGVRCLAQGHLVVVLKVERVLYIHSPHPPPMTIPAGTRFKLANLWVWLSTIRPRLPTWLPKNCNGIGQYVLCESHIKCECFYIILTETGLLDNFLIASWAVVSNSIPGGPQLCEFRSNQLQITPGWKFLVILNTLKAGPGVFE